MHFCFLNMPIEYYSPVSGGAIATIIVNTARCLEDLGHRVSVITRLDGNPAYDVGEVVALEPCGREDLKWWQRRLSGLRWRLNTWDWPFYDYYRRAFQKALRRLSPDVVVAFNDLVSPEYLREAAPQARVLVWLQNEQGTRRSDLTATMRATDGFLACSNYIQSWTHRRHGIAAARIHTVASGVDLKSFHPHADYQDSATPIKVLFVGRLDPNKGPDLAIDVVGKLRAEGLPVTITVAGGTWFYRRANEPVDPYLVLLREKMRAVGAMELGHVPRSEIAGVFRAHDIVCVLSRSNEPFGLVVLEAMASGCAVVASNRGGLPEACGGAAELVDPDDETAVLLAVRSLVADPVKLREARKAACSRARAGTWEVSAAQLLLVVEGLTAEWAQTMGSLREAPVGEINSDQ